MRQLHVTRYFTELTEVAVITFSLSTLLNLHSDIFSA